MNEMLYHIMCLPFIGKIIKQVVKALSGGEMRSKQLRYFIKRKYQTEIGLYSYGTCFRTDFKNGAGEVDIGRYCSIGARTHWITGMHPLENISTSPLFYERYYCAKAPIPKKINLTIGNDVWIGSDVLILPKCKNIGNGAVIGAGSIVTKDVPAYAIVAGNPARIIRYRFKCNEIEALEQSQWWNLEPNEIIEGYDLIEKPIEFCNWIKERHGRLK